MSQSRPVQAATNLSITSVGDVLKMPSQPGPYIHDPDYPTWNNWNHYTAWRRTKSRPWGMVHTPTVRLPPAFDGDHRCPVAPGTGRFAVEAALSDLLNAVLGLAGEWGELREMILDYSPLGYASRMRQLEAVNGPGSRDKVILELGDVAFYANWYDDALGVLAGEIPDGSFGSGKIREGAVTGFGYFPSAQVGGQQWMTDLEWASEMGLRSATRLADVTKKFVYHSVAMPPAIINMEVEQSISRVDQIANLFRSDLRYVLRKNVEKLDKRYPNGFSEGGGVR